MYFIVMIDKINVHELRKDSAPFAWFWWHSISDLKEPTWIGSKWELLIALHTLGAVSLIEIALSCCQLVLGLVSM